MIKKRITLQRLNTADDHRRAIQEIEKVLNNLRVDAEGNIVVGGSVESLNPVTMIGPPGPQGPPGPPGPQGPAGTGGTTGTTLAEETLSFNVPEAAPGVWSVGEVAVHKKALLFRISADQSCIVRLYFNADLRDDDAASGRLPTTNPGPGYILAEVGLDLANGRSQFLSPVPVIYNADDPESTTIYWAVQQTMLVDVEVNVEIMILPLEG